MERMLALGPLTSKLRVSMAGAFFRRGVCFQPSSSSLSPTRATEFSSTGNRSLRFYDNGERIWQIRQLHFKLLKPRACVEVHPTNANVVKTVKVCVLSRTSSTQTLDHCYLILPLCFGSAHILTVVTIQVLDATFHHMYERLGVGFKRQGKVLSAGD